MAGSWETLLSSFLPPANLPCPVNSIQPPPWVCFYAWVVQAMEKKQSEGAGFGHGGWVSNGTDLTNAVWCLTVPYAQGEHKRIDCSVVLHPAVQHLEQYLLFKPLPWHVVGFTHPLKEGRGNRGPENAGNKQHTMMAVLPAPELWLNMKKKVLNVKEFRVNNQIFNKKGRHTTERVWLLEELINKSELARWPPIRWRRQATSSCSGILGNAPARPLGFQWSSCASVTGSAIWLHVSSAGGKPACETRWVLPPAIRAPLIAASGCKCESNSLWALVSVVGKGLYFVRFP